MDVSSPRADKKNSTILFLQALRALAALSVVAYHATQARAGVLSLPASSIWGAGRHGVDIFFIISGFIVPSSIRYLDSNRATALQFFRRRVERVFPLYLLFAGLKLVMHAAGLSHEPLGSTTYIISSLFLLPGINEAGDKVPLLLVAWTLQFEMAFYLLISVALWLGLRLRIFLPTAIGLLACAYFIPALDRTVLDHLKYPYMLEFLLGMFVFDLFRRNRLRLPLAASLAGLALSLVLLVIPVPGFWQSAIVAAAGAFLLVASSIAMERYARAWIPKAFLFLGDASYSIYLVHWILLKYLAPIVKHLPAPIASAWYAWVLVMLALGCFAGAVCYLFVERPINRFFKVRRAVAVSA